MDTVKLEVKTAEEASRPELFIRFVWGTIGYIIVYILSMINGILWVVQWLIVLVTGKRNMAIAGFCKKIFNYGAQWGAYVLMLTDERNPLIPEF